MVWILLLNDMRCANIETLIPVCQGESLEALKTFIESCRVPPYRDGQWGKNFKPPLDWYNPPFDWEESRHFQEVPETVVIGRCIEFRDPKVLLPSIEDLLASAPMDRMNRIAWGT